MTHLARTLGSVTAFVLMACRANAQAPAPAVVAGEYLVKMRPAAVGQVHGKLQGKAFLKAAFPESGTYHIIAADPALPGELAQDPDVEYVEPNYVLQSIEPEMGEQNLNAQAAKYYDQTGGAIRATEAWAVSSAYTGSNRPVVAIVDTGLSASHFVFQQTGALWVNPGEIPGNGIDDDFNGFVDDVNGWNFITNSPNYNDDENHGTHVAGIVLGATQDILAATLEPAKVRLMPLKFLDANGQGSTAAGINAIYYAVNNGARVINCSWGGSAYSRALHDAINYAYAHGVLVVTAAGNYTNNNDVSPMYPAAYDVPSNLAVAATTDGDALASFSNYGPTTVHVGAPGVWVFSTMPGNYFASLSGTSMAAPLVAGAAALALREAPQMSGYQMKSLILSTVQLVNGLSGMVSSGGRINVEWMVNNAKAMTSVASYQPNYVPVYKAERSLASESGSPKAGCGLVQALGAGGGPSSPGASGMLAVLFGLPVLLWFALRRQAPVHARRFDRYTMQSQVTIKSGDRELVGTLNTISLGGLSFNVDEALEKGGSVTLKIAGPGGGEPVEVEGRIVWSEKNNSYGVQFGEVRETVRATLFGWTRNLVRQM